MMNFLRNINVDGWGRESNAFHVDEICLTEDKIVVYNIYVSNFPKNWGEKHLKDHFLKFGDIESAVIYQRKQRKNYFRYAFVNFKDPKSAAKVLKTLHIVYAKRLIVRAADSWKQPTNGKLNNSHEKYEEGNNNENQDCNIALNSLLDLNDDCLLHIFSFLSLREKLKMSNVCQRFQYLFEMTFRANKFLNLNEDDNLTLMEVRQILMQVGHLVEKVSLVEGFLQNNNKRCIDLLPTFCSNLRELCLESIGQINEHTFYNISNNLKSLRTVKLVNCSLSDEACYFLSKLPNLVELDISDNFTVTGKHLPRFGNLQHLVLENCANVEKKFFVHMCKNLNQLKTLNINRCISLDATMARNLLNLEELTICGNPGLRDLDSSNIDELQKLKSLKIYSPRNDDIFTDLSKRENPTLEKLIIIGSKMTHVRENAIIDITSIKELRILHDPSLNDNFLRRISALKPLELLSVSHCPSITISGVLSLLKTSKNLKCLDISMNLQFNDSLIYQILDMFITNTRSEPLTLNISKTNVRESILMDSKYTAYQDMLRLSFKAENIYAFNFEIDERALYDFEDFDFDLDSGDDDDSDLFSDDGFFLMNMDLENDESDDDIPFFMLY